MAFTKSTLNATLRKQLVLYCGEAQHALEALSPGATAAMDEQFANDGRFLLNQIKIFIRPMHEKARALHEQLPPGGWKPADVAAAVAVMTETIEAISAPDEPEDSQN